MDQKESRYRELFGDQWYEILKKEFNRDYFIKIGQRVAKERKQYIVYPEQDDIFRAFRLTPYNNVKVVIIGQDPYATGEADGLAFSIKHSHKVTPSMEKIQTAHDLMDNFNFQPALTTGNLEEWALQGVFLLNSILTVRRNQFNSHKDIGWLHFTRFVIHKLNAIKKPLVFLLWGKQAQEYSTYIDVKYHTVLTAEHPSYAARQNRNWENFGCFKKTNEVLSKNKIEPIEW